VTAAAGLGRWKQGYVTDDGAIATGGSGLSLGAVNATANSYSQELGLVGIDSSGAHQVAYLQATPSGGLNLATTTGTFFGFYNGPVALNTLAASTSNTACLNGQTWSGLYLISLCSSLRKYKGNISRLAPSLAEVMQLTPVSYVSRTNGNAEVGFVAEDVEKVDKRLSTYANGELAGVQYDHMVALLTKAVQEQQQQIKALQQQVHDLQQRK
jgi:Chaperone of endosialidase